MTSSELLYFDTETVGLAGPCVLIQYGPDEDHVQLHHVWERPVKETLRLIERLVDAQVVAFNLTYDWFQLQRLYCALRLLPPSSPPSHEGYHAVLSKARWGPCLRPQAALDLMLYGRTGPLQTLMDRKDVRIKRVPKELALPLAEHLTSRLDLGSIHFARRQKGYGWTVNHKDDDPDFPDVVLNFAGDGGLKAIGRHLLGGEWLDLPIPEFYRPKDRKLRWNVLHKVSKHLLKAHVQFWKGKTAQRYATDDVVLLHRLHRLWPAQPGDTNSELAVAVACGFWHGYSVNEPLLEEMVGEAQVTRDATPFHHQAVMAKLKELCNETELLGIEDTSADTLEALKRWKGHPIAEYAERVSKARTANVRLRQLEKVEALRRAHFDFKVVGTLSNRKAGAGGINAQGLERGQLRHVFVMKEGDEDLEGGDFDGFEATIADAVYQDPSLRAELKAGKKVGALFAEDFYHVNHDQAVKSKKGDQQVKLEGLGLDGDVYNPGKNAFYAWVYGAHEGKVAETLHLEEEDVTGSFHSLEQRFPVLFEKRRADERAFCSMTQPGGLGTPVVWGEPAEKIESLFGFARWFTLENKIVRFLFDLAQDPPFKGFKGKVKRRDRVQTPGGATQSALYAAAFQLQARNMRAAGNHRVQSTGAHVTKELELAIWEHQPRGIHPWVVQPMNVHDEVISPTSVPLRPTVEEVVEGFRDVVPLLSIDWREGLGDWGALK